MKYSGVFDLMAAVIKEKKVRCVLIGGFAINHYKVTRHTADVDFLITEEDFEKILSLLKAEGLKIIYRQEVFARLGADSLDFMDADFMFVDQDTLDKIVKDAQEANIGGRKFVVPSLNHLIALKLHAIKYNPKLREYKDLADIVELIRLNKVNAKSGEFKDICLKFGTQELYDKILDKV